MICFFFLNGAPPIRLNIFGAPPGFDGGVEAGIAGRSGDLREKLQLFIN